VNRQLPCAMDRTTSIFLSATGRPMCAGFLIALLGPTIGSSTMASPIIKSSSIATRISRSLPSTIQRSICTSRRRRSGYITPTRVNGASILLDLDKGVLSVPPVVGEFNGNRGEFYDQEQYKGRAILVRYLWLNISPKSARMEQSFSADGGKTWETNWICELTR
jgi:hypothetical protein